MRGTVCTELISSGGGSGGGDDDDDAYSVPLHSKAIKMTLNRGTTFWAKLGSSSKPTAVHYQHPPFALIPEQFQISAWPLVL